MKATIEISMYPLSEKYTQHVDAFIKSLYKYDLDIHTSHTNTLVVGEFNEVFQAVQNEMKLALEEVKSVFVLKVFGSDLTQEVDLDGYR